MVSPALSAMSVDAVVDSTATASACVNAVLPTMTFVGMVFHAVAAACAAMVCAGKQPSIQSRRPLDVSEQFEIR